MTLNTHIRILAPLQPEGVLAECQRILGGEGARWHDSDSFCAGARVLTIEPGQGLAAWTRVTYGVDGPIGDDPDEARVGPDACIEVSFDTAYAYKGPDGGCNELHRRLTAELGAWLDERNADWWAKDEYTGQWHHRTPCPLAKVDA